MAEVHQPKGPGIEELLSRLADEPERNEEAAAEGRAQFLTQARMLAPAVSEKPDLRLTGCNKNFFERIWNTMKQPMKFFTLATIALLAGIAIFMANKVSTVSAQQILERAAAAQAPAGDRKGIWHTRIEVYENPEAIAGESNGKRTIYESYDDLASGFFRFATSDANGKILSLTASDGKYYYSTGGDSPNEQTRIVRTPVDEKKQAQMRPIDPSAQTKAVFDQFNNNPRVKLEGKITRPDGRQAYVLVNPNVQTEKQANGQSSTTPTGATRMIFDVETYKLLESRITVRKNGQEVVIYEAQNQIDEILPEKSPVAWDLSDLKGMTVVDEKPRHTKRPGFRASLRAAVGRTRRSLCVETNSCRLYPGHCSGCQSSRK